MLKLSALSMAMFVASFAVAQKEPVESPDAMDLYALALERAVAAIGVDGHLPQLPVNLDGPVWTWGEYPKEPWKEFVERTALAQDLFRQASATERCELADPSPGDILADDRLMEISSVGHLVAAHGWIAMADAPARAVDDALALLAFSRQVFGVEHRDGAHLGPAFEVLAMALLEAALDKPIDERTRTRVEEALAAHATARWTMARIADRYRKILDLVIPTPDANASAEARAFDRQVREAARSTLEERLAPIVEHELPETDDASAADRAFRQKLDRVLGERARTPDSDGVLHVDSLQFGLHHTVRCELAYRACAESCRARLSGR